jgi:hypothetical protein
VSVKAGDIDVVNYRVWISNTVVTFCKVLNSIWIS